jgi:glycosyltransferase involved in cell wall biosynthesis
MKILALESYYGGSHKAFLQQWARHSTHDFTICPLPPFKWKWRMRHSAVTFAEKLKKNNQPISSFDTIFCSDMLNLAEFIGLSNPQIHHIPKVLYFHENQLTYPVRFESERDYQFAVTNMTSALSADQVWFNSAFHKEDFLCALNVFLKKMPDHQPLYAVNKIQKKAKVFPPGINEITPKKNKNNVPAILFNARWEHDKNPQLLFDALAIAEKTTPRFRLNIIGQSFREIPDAFTNAKKQFAKKINLWGYQQTKADYIKALRSSDIVISTANHEFFGIAVLEAVRAGAWPILPKRLSYPEIFNHQPEFFYNGTAESLAKKIIHAIKNHNKGTLWNKHKKQLPRITNKYLWNKTAEKMDKAIERFAK